MNSNLIRVGAVAVGAFLVYKHVKNQWAQGAAMTAIGLIVLNQVPIVQDAINTRLISAA